MGSSHSQSDKLLDEFFSVLLLAPVWFGPISAAGIYAAFRWLFPWSLTAGFAGQQAFKLPVDVFSGLSMTFAPWFAGLVLVIWGIAEFRKRTDRKRFDKVTDAKSIADLSWSEFESLISEAFRRQGYTVDQLGGGCPDGGIDHRLSKAGEVVLVQCKHWKNWKVGVKVARELLGVVTSGGVQAGIVVTSGRFTQDAKEFDQKVPIRLIDGTELLKMIQQVQSNRQQASSLPNTNETASPLCPRCHAPMLLRTAKKGANSGSQFWGCPKYPNCRGTREFIAVTTESQG